ncbi:MAG TPA: MlaD family protein [Acidimicrobiales bacterium]|nr:MlaD family protein [Acidimicrobiales bacterium]
MTLTERRQHILTGAIALVLVVALVSVGIRAAFGEFAGGYELVGSFDAAGQGLLPGSDVKVRGVNIGEVKGIELDRGRARVTLRIRDGERVPVDATATIRPKTLFGEKFVDIDPGPAEETGPYLEDGDELAHTLGGFELERVLTELYPVLEAVDPADLTTVLHELADGGRGLGERINRTIVNSEALGEVFADNADLTSEFLTDLAALSDQLAASAEDLVAIAEAGNAALPTLVEGEDDVVALLQQAGRLSNDVADLLLANPGFVEAVFVDGSRTLQVLTDGKDQLVPTVVGIRQYLQTLASAIRIDVGDGTLMAAIKLVLGSELCTLVECPGAGENEPLVPITLPPLQAPDLGLDLPSPTTALADPLGAVLDTTKGLLDSLGGLLAP